MLNDPQEAPKLKICPFSSTFIAFYLYFLLFFTHRAHWFYCRKPITIKKPNMHAVKKWVLSKGTDNIAKKDSRRWHDTHQGTESHEGETVSK